MRIIIIEPDGLVTEGEVKRVDLDLLKSAVGGWIEVVSVTLPGVTAYINEEGKLIGLPHNEFASALMSSGHQAGDYIAGNMVLVGAPDDDGDDTSLPDDLTIGSLVESVASADHNLHAGGTEEL